MREIKIIFNIKPLLTLTTIYTSIHVAFFKFGQCKDFLSKRKQIQTILLKHITEFLNRKFSLKICKKDTAIFVVKSIKEK